MFLFKLYVIINCNFRETFSISFFTILLNTSCSFRSLFSRNVQYLIFTILLNTSCSFRSLFSRNVQSHFYDLLNTLCSFRYFHETFSISFLRFLLNTTCSFRSLFSRNVQHLIFTILLNTTCSFRTNTSTFKQVFYHKPRCSNHVIFCASFYSYKFSGVILHFFVFMLLAHKAKLNHFDVMK